MVDIASGTVSQLVARLPGGRTRVMYRKTPYDLTVTRFNDGKSVKIHAEERGGRDVISANFYFCAFGVYVMPCEMTKDKVSQFVSSLHVSAARPGRIDAG